MLFCFICSVVVLVVLVVISTLLLHRVLRGFRPRRCAAVCPKAISKHRNVNANRSGACTANGTPFSALPLPKFRVYFCLPTDRCEVYMSNGRYGIILFSSNSWGYASNMGGTVQSGWKSKRRVVLVHVRVLRSQNNGDYNNAVYRQRSTRKTVKCMYVYAILWPCVAILYCGMGTVRYAIRTRQLWLGEEGVVQYIIYIVKECVLRCFTI